MKRRDVLTTTAAIAFAGCISGSGGDGGTTDTSPETTDESATADTETRTSGTVPPTETSRPQTVQETETKTTAPTNTPAHPTSTVTETATEPTDTPIPVPDAPTDTRKDTPLAGEAHVAFTDSGSRIVVTGTITGKNGCQTAVLDSVQQTNAGLVITIATERDAPADALCTMALVELEYRFVVTVETSPESVTVIHRGMGDKRTMTTAKPDG